MSFCYPEIKERTSGATQTPTDMLSVVVLIVSLLLQIKGDPELKKEYFSTNA